MCGMMDGRGDDVWNDGWKRGCCVERWMEGAWMDGCLSGRLDAWIGVWVGEQKLDG